MLFWQVTGLGQEIFYHDDCSSTSGWTLQQNTPSGTGNYSKWDVGNYCAIDGSTLGIINYYSGTALWTCGYDWNNPNSNGILAYRTIDAQAHNDLLLQFDWFCVGENYNTTLYDYGQVGYSTDGGNTFIWLTQGGKNNSGKYYDVYEENLVRDHTLELPSILDNSTFILAFKWRHDGSVGFGPGFIIDNIRISGEKPALKETVYEDDFNENQGWEFTSGPALAEDGEYIVWEIDGNCPADGKALSVKTYYPTNDSMVCDYIDNRDIKPNGIVAKNNIQALGYGDLELHFDWACEGEYYNTYAWDYGQVGYSLDNGQTITWFTYGGTFQGKYFNQEQQKRGEVISLPNELYNTNFALVFRWINDYSIGGGTPFTIDNVKILGKAVPLPTTVIFEDDFSSNKGWELETGPPDVDGNFTAWAIEQECSIEGESLGITSFEPDYDEFLCEYIDNQSIMPIGGIKASRTVDATNTRDLILTFDWKSIGEYIAYHPYDYGMVGYSLDNGTSITWFTKGGYNSGKYFKTPTVQKNYTIVLPEELDGKKFDLVFGWFHDYCCTKGFGFIIDNVKVSGVKEVAYSADEPMQLNRVTVEDIRIKGIQLESELFNVFYWHKDETQEYYDGLGRAIQQVAIGETPTHANAVTPVVYDAFGRKDKQYSSFADIGVGFSEDALEELKEFYNSPIDFTGTDYPFARTKYEKSPLNRPYQVGSIGKNWQLNRHRKEIEYGYNITGIPHFRVIEGQVVTETDYSPGSLIKKIALDEDKNKVEQFTDFNGRKVLSRINSATPGNPEIWLSTYYVYNELGRLSVIMPPGAMAELSQALLDKWCFQFEYDKYGNTIAKKVPGIDWEYYAYDQWNRLVATQNPLEKDDGIYSFTAYDGLNRPVYTGQDALGTGEDFEDIKDYLEVTSNYQRAVKRSGGNGYNGLVGFPETNTNVSNLSTIYYDDYWYPDLSGVTGQTGPYSASPERSYQGMVTGLKESTLDETGSTGTLLSTTLYDEYGRTIMSESNGNQTWLKYGITGVVDEQTTYLDLDPLPDRTIKETFTYDHKDRLLTATHQVDNQQIIELSSQEYNALGEVKTKKIHSDNGGSSYLVSDIYTYNERGWLRSINDPKNPYGTEPLSLELFYGQTEHGVKKRHNGNLSMMYWRVDGVADNRMFYEFDYDGVNRLTKAKFRGELISGLWNNIDRFNTNYSYDINGNIKTISRNGTLSESGGNYTYGQTDFLNYFYNGNQLAAVNDIVADNNVPGDFKDNGFENGTEFNPEFIYDEAGNISQDDHKGISSIIYSSYLNKPLVINFNTGAKITYTYTTSGERLYKKVYNSSSTLLAEYQYKGLAHLVTYNGGSKELEFINTSEGRVTPLGSSFNYEYFLTDHLGNVRAVVDKDPNNGLARIIQEKHFYPFGGAYSGAEYSLNTAGNRLLYQGKEWEEENGLNTYDFHARQYDPVLGRFLSADPADQFGAPYVGMGNNPVMMVDPDGEWVHIAIGAAIGGIINVATHWNKIDNSRDFLVAFGIGAAAGAVTALTGGVALTAAGGSLTTLGAGGFLAGAYGGGIGALFGNSLQTIGNTLYFNDPVPTAKEFVAGVAIGAVTGGLFNGIAAAVKGGNFFTGSGMRLKYTPAPTGGQGGKVTNEITDGIKPHHAKQWLSEAKGAFKESVGAADNGVKKIGNEVGEAAFEASGYEWRVVSESVKKGAAKTGTNAFEIAQSGGKHSGFLKNYLGRSPEQINKAINTLQAGKRGMNVHLDKIANPSKYVPHWNTLRTGHQQSLIRGWQKEIINSREQIEILRSILGN